MKVVKSVAVLAVMLMSGCASVAPSHPADPLESINRPIFRFNEKLDDWALKPAATGYVKVVPSPVRSGVKNFLGNIEDAWSFVNSALQAKPEGVGQNMGRVLVNTFLGVGGIFDLATPAGIERQDEDFGQTLAVWGVPRGPYLMLPLLGPSTVRDGVGQGVWMLASPMNQASNDVSYSALALKVLDSRVRLLDVDQIVSDAATDRYSFIRSAYLQRREYLIHDGEVVPQREDDDAPEVPASAAEKQQDAGIPAVK